MIKQPESFPLSNRHLGPEFRYVADHYVRLSRGYFSAYDVSLACQQRYPAQGIERRCPDNVLLKGNVRFGRRLENSVDLHSVCEPFVNVHDLSYPDDGNEIRSTELRLRVCLRAATRPRTLQRCQV